MLSHFSRGQLLANPVISPRSFVHGILQARYWSGLPCPSPEDIPNRGTEATSLNVSCTVRRVLYHWCPVQFSRLVVSDSLRPHESQHAWPPCPSPAPRIHSNTSIESVMPSSHLILCHPLLLLPPIRLSIRVFSNESTLRMRWPKYWSFIQL